MKKRKILFLIESLAGGGAEKVLSTIVQYIDKTSFDVTVCVISGGGKYDEIINNNVNLIKIFETPEYYKGIKKLWYALLYNLIYKILPAWLIYKFIVPKNYDVEVAFVEGFATKIISSSSNRKSKKYAWVHVDLKQHPWTLEDGVFINIKEERAAYNRFDNVVCVSKSVENIMHNYYHLKNVLTIYNPLDSKSIISQGRELSPFVIDRNRFNIVSVGRFTKQKGFDLLLPVMAKIAGEQLKIHLYLLGEGTERRALEKQAAELGISEYVTFTGFQKNPYALMSKMNMFVCSSRAEGYSLAIAESLILGVPVISMNCSGPNELIGNNEYGILCDTYDHLYEEIIAVVKERKTIPCAVPAFVDLQHTMDSIHSLFAN